MDSLDLCNSIRMEFEGVIENKIPLDVFPAKLQDMVLALARQENYSIEYTMASLLRQRQQPSAMLSTSASVVDGLVVLSFI